MKYIGVGGLARTGKNLFCDIATKQLMDNYGLRAKTYALAYALKKECEPFVKEKLGLDVFSEKTEDKNIFRPMLVWYADVKRKQTKGRHWLELLEKHIEIDTNLEKDSGKPVDVVLISDIRFAEYGNDEVHWIKNELNGKLIHLSKYTWGFPTDGRYIKVINDKTKKIYTEPPNITESTNDPKVKAFADCRIEWEDIGYQYNKLLENPYLNTIVRDSLGAIL